MCCLHSFDERAADRMLTVHSHALGDPTAEKLCFFVHGKLKERGVPKGELLSKDFICEQDPFFFVSCYPDAASRCAAADLSAPHRPYITS
jgi:hypothetical protein